MDTASRKWWHSAWFWVAAAAALAVLGFVVFSPTFHGWIERVTRWAEDIMRAHPVSGGAVFFALTAASAMLTFASGVVLVPSATEVWGKPVTFLLLWGGWMAGSGAAYAIGYFARPLLVRLVSREKLEEYQQLVSKRMKFWAALLFCFAAQSEISGYVLGGLRYSFWKFLAAIAIAEAAFALGVIVAGESLLEARPLALAVSVGVLVGAVVAAGMVLRAQKRKRKTSGRK
jgi:uncharacterized membrane protein YdjX (TVP38/TMEM64 family)